MTGMECDICGDPVLARGWCRKHYRRWQRHGDPFAGRRDNRPPELQTEAEIFAWFMPGDPPIDGCWDWPAATFGHGYGRFFVAGKSVSAHVASYQVYHGPTEGHEVLHHCDRPVCCHPSHLHLGTHRENIQEMLDRQRVAVGERLPQAKLTEVDIREIRNLKGVSQRVIAERFGVSQSSISNVLTGKRWAHITPIQRSPTVAEQT